MYRYNYIQKLLLGLQLEQYYLGRFIKLAYNKNFIGLSSHRQKIDRTNKLKLIALMTSVVAFILLFSVVFLGTYYHSRWAFLGFSAIILGFPCIIICATILVSPIDRRLKRRIIQQAQETIKKHAPVVIGITGSYGKTSMKHLLSHILQANHNVIHTPGSINTPVGIARFVIANLQKKHDIIIIEMGAFLPGDIKELCNYFRPDIGILTGITKQHLDRMKTLQNIIKTKYELVNYCHKHKGHIRINSTQEESKKAYQRRQKDQKEKAQDQRSSLEIKKKTLETPSEIETIKKEKQTERIKPEEKILQMQNYIHNIDEVPNFQYKDNFQGISATRNEHNIDCPLLAGHNLPYIMIAMEITEFLNKNNNKQNTNIKALSAISSLPQTKHRLEIIKNEQTKVTVIDDSFNASIESVRSAINIFKNTKTQGRKLYLSPGLVELGKETSDVHYKLGKEMADTFDKYLLINNKGTKALAKGLEESGVKREDIIFFPSAKSAHDNLSEHLQKNDTIIFQNDHTDNY